MRGLLALAGSVGRKVRSRKFELMSSIRLRQSAWQLFVPVHRIFQKNSFSKQWQWKREWSSFMMVMILNWHNLEVKHGVIENIVLFLLIFHPIKNPTFWLFDLGWGQIYWLKNARWNWPTLNKVQTWSQLKVNRWLEFVLFFINECKLGLSGGEGKSDWRILIWNFGEVEILTCEHKFTSLIAKLQHGRIFLGTSHSDNGTRMFDFRIIIFK